MDGAPGAIYGSVSQYPRSPKARDRGHPHQNRVQYKIRTTRPTIHFLHAVRGRDWKSLPWEGDQIGGWGISFMAARAIRSRSSASFASSVLPSRLSAAISFSRFSAMTSKSGLGIFLRSA